MRPPTRFLIDDYLSWVEEVRDERPVVPAGELPEEGGAYLALQHDVDLDLGWALSMARVEAKREIRATYFVMVGADFYDVTSADGARKLAAIAALGHPIGLHFDPRRYEQAGWELVVGLKRDTAILAALGHWVEMVCAHKPLRRGFDPKQLAELGVRTPQRSDEVYVSDSAGGFRDVAVGAMTNLPHRLRCNFHPAWWVGSRRAETVERAVARLHRGVDDAALDWVPALAAHPNAIEHDAREKVAR